MFRFLRSLFRALPQVLAGVFIIVMIWLFLVFPRVVNLLADMLGNMGTPLIAREQLIHTVVALVLSLLPLWYFIIRPFREIKELADGQGLRVRQGQGVAYIDTESARHQIYKAVNSVGGIKHTEVSVDSRDGRAVVMLNLTTENSINAARKKQEVRREIKKVLEDQLGVQLSGEPTINFRLAQIDIDIPRPSEPAAPPVRPAALPYPSSTPASMTVNRPVPSSAPIPAPKPEPTTIVEPSAPTASSLTSPIVGRRAMMPETPPPPASEVILPEVKEDVDVSEASHYEDKPMETSDVTDFSDLTGPTGEDGTKDRD